jgi:hypothetical protein
MTNYSVEDMTNSEKDAHDAKIVLVGKRSYDPDHYQYYEDMEEYKKLLLEDNRKLPEELDHELSHGICALSVGVRAVKYGFQVHKHTFQYPDADPWTYVGIIRPITSMIGPSPIPILAHAAIQAAPVDPSESDLYNMKELGYSSLGYLEERIDRWNRQDNALFIPMPGTIEIPS